mgnify:FL=1
MSRISQSIKVAITIGDPSGIGTEVVLKALSNSQIQNLGSFLIIGNGDVLDKASSLIAPAILSIHRVTEIASLSLAMTRHPVTLLDIKTPVGIWQYGKVDSLCGLASIQYIDKGFALIRKGIADVLVTAPISKEAINQAGFRYPGHTEYLAHLTNTRDFGMMLVGGDLRVVLVTTHLPLRKVHRAINESRIYKIIKLTNQALVEYFGLAMPRIGVCSLNPHCGDGGVFGDEEERIIKPAVLNAFRDGVNVNGPISADIIFHKAYVKKEYDAVVAMYHDQGLAPLKMVAFERGVNITLGLPFVRTSPDHGTGFDIAGKGLADASSMEEAIRMAVSIESRRRKTGVINVAPTAR